MKKHYLLSILHSSSFILLLLLSSCTKDKELAIPIQNTNSNSSVNTPIIHSAHLTRFMEMAMAENRSAMRIQSDQSWEVDTAIHDLEYALAYRTTYKLDETSYQLGLDTLYMPISLNYEGEINTSEMLDFYDDVLQMIYNHIYNKYGNYSESKSIRYIDLSALTKNTTQLNVRIVFSTIGIYTAYRPVQTDCYFPETTLYPVNNANTVNLINLKLNSTCNPFWQENKRTLVRPNNCTSTLIPGYRWVKVYQPGTMTPNLFTIEPANTMDVPCYQPPFPPYHFQILSAPPFQFALLNVDAITMKDQVDGFAVYGNDKKNIVFNQLSHDVYNYEVDTKLTSNQSISGGVQISAYYCKYSTAIPAFILVSEALPTFYTGLYIGSGQGDQ